MQCLIFKQSFVAHVRMSRGADCSTKISSYLSYKVVKLLLGPKPLYLLVYSLVLFQLLHLCPATVQV